MSNPQDIIDDFEKSIKMSKSEWKTKKEKGKERIEDRIHKRQEEGRKK